MDSEALLNVSARWLDHLQASCQSVLEGDGSSHRTGNETKVKQNQYHLRSVSLASSLVAGSDVLGGPLLDFISDALEVSEDVNALIGNHSAVHVEAHSLAQEGLQT